MVGAKRRERSGVAVATAPPLSHLHPTRDMDRVDTRAVITSLRSALYYLDTVGPLSVFAAPIERNVKQSLQLVEEHAEREGIDLPAYRSGFSQIPQTNE